MKGCDVTCSVITMPHAVPRVEHDMTSLRATEPVPVMPTILGPSSGGTKKRRRDGADAEEDADADGRSVVGLISAVLSGPPPVPIVLEDDAATACAKQDRKAGLRAQLAAAKAENDAVDARRKEVFGSYANLSSVYNYGLSHIAKLNDLSGAPDNTLPGNHPEAVSADTKKE